MGTRKKEKNENFLDTPSFTRELAERAGFSISDTKIFMDNFQGLLADSIEQGVDLDLRGLFHLYISDIKGFDGVNAHASKLAGETIRESFPPSRKAVIKLATNMTDLLRAEDKKKIKKSVSESV